MEYIEGIKALICGITTVFVVLILISLVISLFKYIKPRDNKKEATKVVQTVVTKTEATRVKEQDDLELVAVITAAIAASMNTTVDRLVVTSFRKIR